MARVCAMPWRLHTAGRALVRKRKQVRRVRARASARGLTFDSGHLESNDKTRRGEKQRAHFESQMQHGMGIVNSQKCAHRQLEKHCARCEA